MDKRGATILFEIILIMMASMMISFLNPSFAIEKTFANTALSFLGKPPLNNTLIEIEILNFTNEERLGRGLRPLTWNDQLSFVARKHSNDMYERDFFEHQNPDGDWPTDRAKKLGISMPLNCIAENAANVPLVSPSCGLIKNEKDAAKCFVESWVDSPGHRDNLLSRYLDEIGVGTYCSKSQCWSTQNFR